MNKKGCGERYGKDKAYCTGEPGWICPKCKPKNEKTWRLIHPDGTESLMNYNPEEKPQNHGHFDSIGSSDVCRKCKKPKEKHLTGWDKHKEYCSFYPNIHFEPTEIGTHSPENRASELSTDTPEVSQGFNLPSNASGTHSQQKTNSKENRQFSLDSADNNSLTEETAVNTRNSSTEDTPEVFVDAFSSGTHSQQDASTRKNEELGNKDNDSSDTFILSEKKWLVSMLKAHRVHIGQSNEKDVKMCDRIINKLAGDDLVK